MKFSDAAKALDGIPYTSVQKGEVFYRMVLDNNVKDVLELGFAHGCSACYFAAALEETGGHLDGVDLVQASFSPTIDEVSSRLGLSSLITPHRETSSYTWWLKKKIEQQTRNGHCEPCYDLIFIDGPKDWTNDGAAFFMADKLLRPGGLMLLDDIGWTYRQHEKATGRPQKGHIFPEMSEEELSTPQVDAIFHLLVTQHPSYSDFQIIDDVLACARKSASGERTLTMVTKFSPAYSIKKAIQRVLRRTA